MRIAAKNIQKNFNGKEVLSDFSIAVAEGEFVCITGESGCGKTTLLNILTGMDTPSSGEVIVDGEDIFTGQKEKWRTKLRNGKIGYMMQGTTLLENLTVYENLKCPLELNGKKAEEEEIRNLLETLGIFEVKNAYPSQLSGGEYRRASLARTLILQPEILFADEPTSNLDQKSAAIVRKVLYDYKNESRSVVVVTHDLEFLRGNAEVDEASIRVIALDSRDAEEE